MGDSILADVVSFVIITISYVSIYTWTSRVIYPFLPSFFLSEVQEKQVHMAICNEPDVPNITDEYEKRRYSLKQGENKESSVLMSATFNVTTSCSILLIELYLFQLVSFLSSSANRISFKLNLYVLMFMVIVLIPLVLIYLLASHFYNVLDLGVKLLLVFKQVGIDFFTSHYYGINDAQQQQQQVNFITFAAFLLWLVAISSVQVFFPSTNIDVDYQAGPDSQSPLIKFNDTEQVSLIARYIINVALVGITIMGSVTGFNTVLTINRNLFNNRYNGSASLATTTGEKLRILRRNLRGLIRNHQEICNSLELKQQKFDLLKKSTGLELYSQLNLNELALQINSFQSYLNMINSNILKTKQNINSLESSTSLFYDLLHLDFSKLEIFFNKMMMIYCAYRLISVFLIKVPLVFYNNVLSTPSTSSTSSSLSISLKNYVFRTYYQEESNSFDEILLLSKIELFISLFFFVSCFTGVLSTFNNLILISSKISNNVAFPKKSSNNLSPSPNANYNPYSASVSTSPIAVPITEGHNDDPIQKQKLSLMTDTTTPKKLSNNETSVSSGSARVKYSHNGVLTPTRTKTFTHNGELSSPNRTLGISPLRLVGNANTDEFQTNNNTISGLKEPFEVSSSTPYSEIDINNIHGCYDSPGLHSTAQLSQYVSGWSWKPSIFEQLRLLSTQSQTKLISNCEKLLISQLTAIYIVATSLMVRSTFSDNSISIVNTLYGLSLSLNPHYLDYLFEFWFVVASITTTLILVFDAKQILSISGANDTEEDLQFAGQLEGVSLDEESVVQNNRPIKYF